ncbi:MAG: hypothetical protein ACOY3Y_05410 [Acidobacteriota bacterium]
MTACKGRVCASVKRPVFTPESRALLAFVADALQRHIERDAGLQAATANLLRGGRSLRVRVEAAPGDARPRVEVANLATDVPEWSAADHALLRSLGISHEPRPVSVPDEPGRRESR